MKKTLLILSLIIITLPSCASPKKVMKDCKPVDQSWFICDQP
jgi:hypothetical protein